LTLLHTLPEIVSNNDEILGFPFNYMPSAIKFTILSIINMKICYYDM